MVLEHAYQMQTKQMQEKTREKFIGFVFLTCNKVLCEEQENRVFVAIQIQY